MTVTPALAATRPRPARLRVRWNIFLFLFVFALIGYLQRTTLSVAGVPMMQELSLSEQQLAWLFDAFILGYTIMQFPGGLLGQRLGARLTLVLIELIAVAAMLVTPLAPLLCSG
ncbi:MAG TPA: MFS transporter, partial [Candidatus Dormibacteraeota bacterium]|nr:MFS transporter [Candidatus Dormibacteraeota bacterium]